jgi:2-methylcitrate dehydratase PrpD
MSGFCRTFASWATGATNPDNLREEARLALLDTFGCVVAGWDEPQTKAALRAFAADSTATAEALILGTAAHALDFDDYEVPGSTHPSAPILGSLLGLARVRPVKFSELLDAYVAGFEAIVRLGEWMRYDHYNAGWHATSTLGTVGAAAASARLLGLDAPTFANALAISASLAGGLKVQFGTDAKALHAGFAARAGVEAAQLAAAGAEASQAVFERRFGFAAVHHGASADPGGVLASIGHPVGIAQHAIQRKPWPSCAYTHRVIDAALAVRPRLPDQAQWASIIIRMPEPFFRVSGFLQPENANEARFSATYTTAAALLDGVVGPESFRPGAWHRPDILALLSRVNVDAYDPGPGLDDMSPNHPDTVAVRLTDGRFVSETVSHVMGGPDRPMTLPDLRAKFALCGGDSKTADLILSAPANTLVQLVPDPSGPLLVAHEGPI